MEYDTPMGYNTPNPYGVHLYPYPVTLCLYPIPVWGNIPLGGTANPEGVSHAPYPYPVPIPPGGIYVNVLVSIGERPSSLYLYTRAF